MTSIGGDVLGPQPATAGLGANTNYIALMDEVHSSMKSAYDKCKTSLSFFASLENKHGNTKISSCIEDILNHHLTLETAINALYSAGDRARHIIINSQDALEGLEKEIDRIKCLKFDNYFANR